MFTIVARERTILEYTYCFSERIKLVRMAEIIDNYLHYAIMTIQIKCLMVCG